MIISEEQLYDYMNCPAYYDMKHNKKIPYSKPMTLVKIMEDLSNYMLTKLMGRMRCSEADLKKKLDEIAEKYKISSKDMLLCLNYMHNMSTWFKNNPVIVADFNSDYQLYTKNDNSINIKIGAVLVDQQKKVSLMYGKFSSRAPEQFQLDRKLKYTLDAKAFHEINRHYIDNVKVIHFKEGTEYGTVREITDYDRVDYIIDGVCNGIEAGSYYPRESVFCGNCHYKQFCKHWIP